MYVLKVNLFSILVLFGLKKKGGYNQVLLGSLENFQIQKLLGKKGHEIEMKVETPQNYAPNRYRRAWHFAVKFVKQLIHTVSKL